MTSSIEYLRKRTSLSLGAPGVQMADFLIESLRGQSSLSLEAQEVQMHAVLNGILKVVRRKHAMLTYESVSYTHLTLPTKREV